ncbi:MAG TPA: hypothetical protein VGR62_03030 [Candidatus Binatia bacterium]|jgi:hypothetical protein|nr:hypothetical protein [Candidatus Binatia bacterium]
MRNPRRSRNLAWLTVVASVAAIWIAFRMPDAGQGFTVQSVLGIGGICVLPFAFVLAIMRTAEARRYVSLARGKGLVARWTVSPTEWIAFVAGNAALDAERGGANLIDLHGTSATNGVDVVVTRDAISVGGDFHPFERNVAITIGPDWVELDQFVSDPNGSDANLHYRFPMVPEAAPAMERLAYDNAAAYQAALANPWTKVWVVLGLVGVLLFAVVVTLIFAA